MNLRPVYWEGHEGQGLLEAADDHLTPGAEFAPDFIVRTVMENPGQIHLICIGPLTNAALALRREPRLAQNLAHLTIMGGVIRGPGGLDLPYAEHNIICDPEAAHIVFASGAPITLVPLDMTVQVRIDTGGLAQVRAANTPFHAAVARQLELYPRFAAQGWTNLHDPLAVAAVIDSELMRWQPVHVDVELTGRHTAGATLMRLPRAGESSSIRVATDVDVSRAEAFIVRRLAR
jgi:purine nucleosidase